MEAVATRVVFGEQEVQGRDAGQVVRGTAPEPCRRGEGGKRRGEGGADYSRGAAAFALGLGGPEVANEDRPCGDIIPLPAPVIGTRVCRFDHVCRGGRWVKVRKYACGKCTE